MLKLILVYMGLCTMLSNTTAQLREIHTRWGKDRLARVLLWEISRLREVVRRGYRQRELSSDEMEIEMYAAELRVENRSKQPKRFLIRRRECEPSAIREICDGSGLIAWNSVNGHINFEIELSPGQSKLIGIRFHELAGNGYNGDNLPHRFKAMLRRYLCEVRDNYVTTTKSRLADLMSR